MLTRFRIEVEGAYSAAMCEDELAKYEHAIQVAEAERYGLKWGDRKQHAAAPEAEVRAELAKVAVEAHPRHLETVVRRLLSDHGEPITIPWGHAPVSRDYYNELLGREVTDEVIEYDSSLPGYRGRRVVQFKRIDTRRDAPLRDDSAAA